MNNHLSSKTVEPTHKKNMTFVIRTASVVLASSAVDHGFKPRSGQTKDYNIDICCFSAKHEGVRAKTDWLRIRIMCLSEATCLSTDCCFSELAL